MRTLQQLLELSKKYPDSAEVQLFASQLTRERGQAQAALLQTTADAPHTMVALEAGNWTGTDQESRPDFIDTSKQATAHLVGLTAHLTALARALQALGESINP
jgi:hypothetical protein